MPLCLTSRLGSGSFRKSLTKTIRVLLETEEPPLQRSKFLFTNGLGVGTTYEDAPVLVLELYETEWLKLENVRASMTGSSKMV